MTWDMIASELFTPRPGIIVALILLFAIPFTQVLAYAMSFSSRPLVLISSLGGRWESATGWLRDWVGIPYLVGVVAWHIYLWIPAMEFHPWNINLVITVIAILLVTLNEIARSMRKRNLMRLLDFTNSNRPMQPHEFFRYYYAAHGPLRQRLPAAPRTSIEPLHIDARPARATTKHAILPLVRSVRTLMIVLHMTIFADKCRGPEYARKTASNLTVISAARIINLTQMNFSIEGIDKIRTLDHPFIYCFNHTSALDFNLIPLFMLAHRDLSGIDMPLVPLFMIARDHFLKNPLYHRIIGIGRVAEIVGMVFVERKHSTKATAADAVARSVGALLEGRGPLAIYPQGSRARPTFTAGGARMDAGYYTVGPLKRLARDGGHLKKGAAFIATDAALARAQLGKDGQVNVVPVAFVGAATVLPRKKLRVQRGCSVTMRVGNPIIVTPAAIASLTDDMSDDPRLAFVDRLSARIDDELKSTFRIHAELERRFFEDSRTVLDALQMEELAIAMKQWRGEDYLVYAIADCIYACHPRHWHPLLGQLTHLILEDASREDFLAFKGKVVEHMPK